MGRADNVEARPVRSKCNLDGAFFPCAGPIPEALGALTNLMRLNLGNNQLAGDPL